MGSEEYGLISGCFEFGFLTICGIPKLLAEEQGLRYFGKVRDCRCAVVFI